MIWFNPHSTPARFLFFIVVQAVSDSLPPHGLQHASLPCPSPSPGVCPKFMSIESVMPSNHLILCVLFSFYLQFFPASGSFPVSQLFTSGVQSIGAWASASVLPMNSGLISFRMDWLDLLAVRGTLKSLLQHHSLKASLLRCSASLWSNTQESACNTGDWVRSLGWEDPLKKGKATHSSVLAWRISWTV